MPHKKKNKEEEERPTPKPSSKLLFSSKPIITWSKVAQSKTQQDSQSKEKTKQIQKWVMSLTKSPELLKALENTFQDIGAQNKLKAPSLTSKISKSIKKTLFQNNHC